MVGCEVLSMWQSLGEPLTSLKTPFPFRMKMFQYLIMTSKSFAKALSLRQSFKSYCYCYSTLIVFLEFKKTVSNNLPFFLKNVFIALVTCSS